MATYAMERDLIATLDSDPEFRDAVRARLLTPELLELPETTRRLEATLQQFIEKTDRRFDDTDRRIDSLEATLQKFMENTDRRLDALEETQHSLTKTVEGLSNDVVALTKTVERLSNDVAALTKTVERLSNDVAALTKTVERLSNDVAALTKTVGGLTNDVGNIRGYFARDVFIRRAALMLPRRTKFDLKSKLLEDDVAAIMRDADTSGVDDADLDSFEDADALLLVTDPEGDEHYVAVEVSYTVHTEDVARANRNAELLAEWTGLPSHAAVAGVNLHDAAWKMSRDTKTTYLRINGRMLTAR